MNISQTPVFTPFRILTVTVLLSVLGIWGIQDLAVQWLPSKPGSVLEVAYTYPGQEARQVELQLTLKVESQLSSIAGIGDIRSTSTRGRSLVRSRVAQDMNPEEVRREARALLRRLQAQLPAGVSPPQIKLSQSGKQDVATLLLWGRDPYELEQLYNKQVEPLLSRIPGMAEVSVQGRKRFQWTMTPLHDDPLPIREIALALEKAGMQQVITTNESAFVTVQMHPDPQAPPWQEIYLPVQQGGLLPLTSVMKVDLQPDPQQESVRANQLPALLLSVYYREDASILRSSARLIDAVAGIQSALPEGYFFKIVDNSADLLQANLDSSLRLALFALLGISLSLFLIARSVRYWFLLLFCLLVNLALCALLYRIFHIPIHFYTLAASSVSLGLVVDNYLIVMERAKRGSRVNAVIELWSAVLTTLLPLAVLALAGSEGKAAFSIGFFEILSVNLIISIAIASLVLPALLAVLPLPPRPYSRSSLSSAATTWWTWMVRYRWPIRVAFVLALGIPLALIGRQEILIEGKNVNTWRNSLFYQQYIRPWAEPVLGGAWRLFDEKVAFQSALVETGRPAILVTLYVDPDASNEEFIRVREQLETWVGSVDEVDFVLSKETGNTQTNISITVKRPFESTGFPFLLKSRLERIASETGDLNWFIRGDGKFQDGRPYRKGNTYDEGNASIFLVGTDYLETERQAKLVAAELKRSPRVLSAGVIAGRTIPIQTYLWAPPLGVGPKAIGHEAAQRFLSPVAVRAQGFALPIAITPHNKWQQIFSVKQIPLRNEQAPFYFDPGGWSVGVLRDNQIDRFNRKYTVRISYTFQGSLRAESVFREQVQRSCGEQLPIGYHFVEPEMIGSGSNSASDAWIWAAGALLIWVVLGACLESWRKALVVWLMIPAALIGVMLVFGLSDLTWDEGGLVSIALVAGASVNLALYQLAGWSRLMADADEDIAPIKAWAMAWKEITPSLISTTLTTIAGVLPFLFLPVSPFWTSLAGGILGGLLMSLLATYTLFPGLMIGTNE